MPFTVDAAAAIWVSRLPGCSASWGAHQVTALGRLATVFTGATLPVRRSCMAGYGAHQGTLQCSHNGLGLHIFLLCSKLPFVALLTHTCCDVTRNHLTWGTRGHRQQSCPKGCSMHVAEARIELRATHLRDNHLNHRVT